MGDSAPAETTRRAAAKADRRQALLSAAARLFAEHGYERVRLEDLGSASGISGPGVYRHFISKAAVLAEVLLTASRDLIDGGRQIEQDGAERGQSPAQVLARLVRFHADFALQGRDVIAVQGRERRHLEDRSSREMARLQRRYIRIWARQLQQLHPEEDQRTAVFRAQAVFGLINSTPHSVRRSAADRASRQQVLEAMALAALSASAAIDEHGPGSPGGAEPMTGVTRRDA